jgi:DNA-binding transcriptional MerR regulator/methylmalonyl-CoA mutase cobalamin-binding subunit
VALRTGLSPHLIRIWEKRYQAVVPYRSNTNRRLYSDEDIERLTLLRRATQSGEAISQIAVLSTDELRGLVAKSSPAIQSDNNDTDFSSAEYHLKLCLDAVKNLDSVNLESRLLGASVALGQQVLLNNVLHPLLEKTGEFWSNGELQVVHEHLASAIVRSLLGSMVVTSRISDTAPLLLVTTLRGQLHEFGALMAAVTAVSEGWRAIYLGPNLPAEDIASAALHQKARAIALSVIYPADDPVAQIELRKLGKLINQDITLIVGGRAASGYHNVIKEIGAVNVTDLTDFKEKLSKLRKVVM